MPSTSHRNIRIRRAYYTAYNKAARIPQPLAQDRIIGIDGEGVGRMPHRYVYLAAADETGKTWSVEPASLLDKPKLSTIECLDFILGLPARSLIVGYAFLYDLTKILEDLPEKALFLLFREKLRARLVDGRIIYRPITWNGYRINFMNRRFTVQKGTRRATVWDIFRFFQSKFTTALIDWKVAAKDKLERMAEMKDLRAKFDQLSPTEIHDYCKEECAYLSKLARSLIDAHTGAGIKLKSYFGAGSTASALLKSWGIKDKRGTFPEEMRQPLACAFFGGRFETSVVGPIQQRVYEYDISSAYPYQATLLPCLLHGSWKHVTGSRSVGAISRSRLALIRWTSRPPDTLHAWGVLPLRAKDGTIAFPLGASSGWTWKEEWIAAQRLNPTVTATEAWCYETDCDCSPPFSELPRVYNERVRLGSDTRGYPLKLGSNSVYGKLAQSRGYNPPFQSWIWSGNITSGTRAQLLGAIANAKDPWNVLSLATDGIQSLEPLALPKPIETGTGATGKPLGGWTSKLYPEGVFYVRPGIYFPLNASDDEIKIVRARGIGKKVLYDQRHRILEAWDAGADSVEFEKVSRFVGAVSGITCGKVNGVKRRATYGDWVEHPIEVRFDPRPKRQAQRTADNRLLPHMFFAWDSVPYKAAKTSPEEAEAIISDLMTNEQPNLDFERA